MPYRIDIAGPPANAIEVLIELGALDLQQIDTGLAAILPDSVTPEAVARALGSARIAVSPATPRDDGSVWLLSPPVVRIGALRLIDSEVFGSGSHPSTALCLEAIEELLATEPVDSILDVGTGSGILALASLTLGVAQAVALDIDPNALRIAAQNATLNNLQNRLQLHQGGPEAVAGQWPLVVANILATPLIEMAPNLVQRLGSRGRLVLAGIHQSLGSEVRQAYRRLGLHHLDSRTRAGWTTLIARASW